jgi:hypothetical protein
VLEDAWQTSSQDLRGRLNLYFEAINLQILIFRWITYPYRTIISHHGQTTTTAAQKKTRNRANTKEQHTESPSPDLESWPLEWLHIQHCHVIERFDTAGEHFSPSVIGMRACR